MAFAQDGAAEETEPFLHGPVGCDDEAGDPMTADYELVEISRLLGCAAMESQTNDDEQVRGQERAEGAVHVVSTLAWAMPLK